MEHLIVDAEEAALRRNLTAAFESIKDRLEDHRPLGPAPLPASVENYAKTLDLLGTAIAEAQQVVSALANLAGASQEALLIAGSSDCALLIVRQTLAELTAELDSHV